jgi:GMP synthase (glutamine-hydrolysing)
MLPLVLIRNEPDDTLGIAPAALAEEGFDLRLIDAWGTEQWPALDEVAGVLSFGGAMNCDQDDRYPFLAVERALLEEAIARDLPVLGVCLGAQLLVRAFGCPVFPAARRELGFPEISLTPAAGGDPVLGALPPRPRFFQWHEDAFAEPAGATVLALGDDEGDGVQAFRHGSRWGVQFHPEVSAEELDGWFTDNAATLQPAWGRVESELRAETAEHLPAANEHGSELFRRFARFVRGTSPDA